MSHHEQERLEEWQAVVVDCVPEILDGPPILNEDNISASQSGSNVNGPGRADDLSSLARAVFEVELDPEKRKDLEDAVMENSSTAEAPPPLSYATTTTDEEVDETTPGDDVGEEPSVYDGYNLEDSFMSHSQLSTEHLSSHQSSIPRNSQEEQYYSMHRYLTAFSKSKKSFHLPSGLDEVVCSFEIESSQETIEFTEEFEASGPLSMNLSTILMGTGDWTEETATSGSVYASDMELSMMMN